MSEHTPTPWNAASAYSSVCGVPIVNSKGQRVGNTALPDLPPEWAEMKERAVADAALIVEAVNNHAPMIKSLEHCAKLFDVLAQTMDRWAQESLSGGWSTHQVQDNRKRADDCRRYAAHIRSSLPAPPSRVQAGRCAKCGHLTNGEEALVGEDVWCHPCADAAPELPGHKETVEGLDALTIRPSRVQAVGE